MNGSGHSCAGRLPGYECQDAGFYHHRVGIAGPAQKVGKLLDVVLVFDLVMGIQRRDHLAGGVADLVNPVGTMIGNMNSPIEWQLDGFQVL